MCDSPSVCSKRKDEFDLLIGTIVEGLVVDHNPYTGGCELRKTEETCICANGNSNHPRIPDRCVDVRECAQNPCSGNAYTGQCIERWGSYECVCIPSEAVHPLSGGVPDLRRCVSAENCDDNPPPCISRKREWEPRIGISYLGKVVSHNPYTGRCGSRLAVWSECECTAGYSHNTSRWNLLDCRDVNQCGPNTCTKSHLQTGVCREMHGSYECVCSSFGEHPASGGFNNGKNWTACQPALKCRSGVCQQQKDGFSQQTDPLIVHNAYSGGCTDDPLYGATCKCNPGFANRGGVNSTTCEDIKECEAGKCPDDGTYTGECREMIGTHECVCHDPQGKHPDTGGFNATTRENTEKDWSKCEPAIQCETGVCPRLKEEFAPRVERPDVLHNAYSGTCVFDPVFGATCVCHPGFRNLGGLRSTECEDVKECNAPENCPPTLFYTGQCKELIGSFECLCRDVGAHPTFGGFVPEIGGPGELVDLTTCRAAFSCADNPCVKKRDEVAPKVGKELHHNPYGELGLCLDDPVYGAVCSCAKGFKNRGGVNSLDCIDVDECEDMEANCGLNSGGCVNTVGSFSCTCNFGLEDKVNEGKLGARLNCVDRNECVEGVRHGESTVEACDPVAALCVNKDMLVDKIPYSCQCYEGWETKADIPMTDYKTGCKDCCTDVDECANGTHHCSDICESGSRRDTTIHANYTCGCRPGRFLLSSTNCADCVYKGWLPFSGCSEPCGLGERTRRAIVVQPRADNPFIAPRKPEELCVREQRVTCLLDPVCKHDSCEYGPWSAWSDCSVPCGRGASVRTRAVIRGLPSRCNEDYYEERICNSDACVPRNDGMSAGVISLITVFAIVATTFFGVAMWWCVRRSRSVKSESITAIELPGDDSNRRASPSPGLVQVGPRPRKVQRR